LTGQAVYAFVTLKPYVVASFSTFFGFVLIVFFDCSEFKYDTGNESGLSKELILQVRKVIGPFAAPKKIIVVPDLPKTRSGKARFFPLPRSCFYSRLFFFSFFLKQIMRRIMRKIVDGEGDKLGDLSTLANPEIVDVIKKKVAESV
jgi:acetyl-CoA synthetase